MRRPDVIRHYSLDGLRGFAAFVVATSHLSNLIGSRTFGSGAGQIGVMIFFALSGFLMGHLYLNQTMTISTVFCFFQKRIARVVPLYLLMVLGSFWLLTTFGIQAYPIGSLSELAEHLLLQRGESVLWTVVIEMQFYMLLPVFWFARQFLGGRSTQISFLALIIALVLFQSLEPAGSSVRSLSHVAHFFVIGLMVSMMTDEGPRLPIWNFIFLAALGSVALLYPGIWQETSLGGIWQVTVQGMWSSPVYMFVVGALLLSTLRSELASKVFGSWPMRFLGAISYSFYLLHDLIFRLLAQFDYLLKSSALFFVVSMSLAILAALLSYTLFELPARNLVANFSIPTGVDDHGHDGLMPRAN